MLHPASQHEQPLLILGVLAGWCAGLAGEAAAPAWALEFAGRSAAAGFLLDNVPPGTTHISATTAWPLRKRLPVTFAGQQFAGKTSQRFAAENHPPLR